MGYRNREKEIKLRVDGTTSRTLVDKLVQEMFKDHIERSILASSKDVYWGLPSKNNKFIRVRYMAGENGKGQMTIKDRDKGIVSDRIEIDVSVDSADQCVLALTAALGRPHGVIHKTYSVLFLDEEKETNISVYKVTGDDRVFVEVEARRNDIVEKIVRRIEKELPFKTERSTESLFDIFIADAAKKALKRK
jgi:hypothetical protein